MIITVPIVPSIVMSIKLTFVSLPIFKIINAAPMTVTTRSIIWRREIGDLYGRH